MRITKRRSKKRALITGLVGFAASLVLIFSNSLNANATYWADQCASGTGYTATLTSGTATCTVTFKTVGNTSYTVPSVAKNIKFLVVGGGGGGGGGRAGGGGGGGVARGEFGVNDPTYGDASSVSSDSISGKSLTITVGFGASGGSQNRGAAGGSSKIADSSTTFVRAYGGGGGGYHLAANSFACMGGAGEAPVSGPKLIALGNGAGAAMNYAFEKCISEVWTAVPAGSVTLHAGNYGGESFRNSDNTTNDQHRFAGGGAGAGAIGAGYTGTSATWDANKAPNGGEGVTSPILAGIFGSGGGGADGKGGDSGNATGENAYYTGGGGVGGTNAGNGECLTKWDAGVNNKHSLQSVSNGVANFGGGGGGGIGTGGSGGSGVVALQFSIKPTLNITGPHSGFNYTGSPIPYPVSRVAAGTGELLNNEEIASAEFTYQGAGQTTYSLSSTPPTNAGSYLVTISNVYLTTDGGATKFPASDFYSTNYTATTFAINKATPAIWSLTDFEKGAGDANTTITRPSTLPPSGTFVYTSSDPTVVSVSGSTLSYLSAGTATISAVFTPTDTANWYTSASTNVVTITVKDRFTITYKKEDTTTTVSTTSVLRGNPITLATAPTGTGTFVGWFDASSGGNRYSASASYNNVQSDLTFYERRVRVPSVQMSVKVGDRTTETITQNVTRGLTIGQAAVMNATATSPDSGTLDFAWGYSSVVSGTSSSGSLLNTTTSATQSPSTVGTYNYTVTVTNTVSGVTASKQLTFTATVSQALTFSAVLADVTGATRSSTLVHKDRDGLVIATGTALTSGGLAPITFSWTGGTIPGLTFSTSTGKFSGSPTTSGLYPGEVWATDANGYSIPTYQTCLTRNGVPQGCQNSPVNVSISKSALDKPNAPTVTVTSPTSMVVRLNGTVTDAGSYTITATPAGGGTPATFDNFVDGSQIDGLDPNTSYDVTVTAVPTNTQFLNSDPSTATTKSTYKWFYDTIYDANGGTFTSGATSLTGNQYWDPNGTVLMFSGSDLPTRAGYVFTGWASSSTGTRADVDSDYVFSPPNPPADSTFYAVWGAKPTALTVITNNNGGVNKTTNAANYDDSVSVYITENSGYTFSLEGQGTGSGTLSYLFQKKLATDSAYSNLTEDTAFTSAGKHGIKLTGLTATSGIPHKVLFTLTNTDLYTPSAGASRTITVNIYVAPVQTVSYSPASFYEKGQPMTLSVTRSGGRGPFTYALGSGTLPTGLSLDSSTGEITGTPTALVTRTIRIFSTDLNGDSGGWSVSFDLAIKTTLVASAPTSVTRASDTSLTVNFPAVTNAASYIVRVYNASTGGTQVGSDWTSFTAGTNNTITGLTQNTTYYVGVTAVGSGNYVTSSESSRVSATTYKTNYNVTWDTLGGTAVSATTYTWNGSITKPASNPTRAGYEFEGWGLATTTTYGARLFVSGNTYTPPSVGDITIYAIWSDYAALDYTYTITGKSAVTVNASATSNTIRVSVPNGVSISFSASASVQRGGTITYGWGYNPGNGYASTGTNSTFSISNIPAGGLIVDLDVKNSDAYSPLGLTKTVQMVITSAQDLTLSYPSTSSGEVTKLLSVPATQGGGASPFTYAVATGTLPAGMSLNTSTGAISGYPTSVESQVVSIRVTDANGTITTSSPFTISSTLIARTLTFNAAYLTKTIGQTQQLIAPTLTPNGVSSVGTMTYSAGSSTACTVDNSGLVTITHGTGTCSITATLSQSGNYAAATTATPSAVPVGLASQSITVATGDTTYGTNPTLASSGSTGTGAVTYAKVSGPCAISGTVLRTTGAGNCVITASIAADNDYASATSAQKTIAIAAKAITVTANVSTSSVVYGNTLPTLSVSTVAGALVGSDAISSASYKYSATGYASSATAPTNVGTYTVTPESAVFSTGSASDYSITYATATFNITQATPTFTAPSNVTKTYGDADFTLPTPTSSTTGTWTYASSSDSVVRVTGSTASIQKVGTVTVTATFTPSSTTNYVSGGTTTFTITVGALALTKPVAPSLIASTSATTNVNWSIAGDSNATSYVIRQYTTATGGTPAIYNVTVLSGFIGGHIAGTNYWYTVTVKGYGNYSDSPESDRAQVTTRSSRTISFSTTSYVKRYNDTFTITATQSAGTGAISYNAGSSSACSVVSTSGVVRMTAPTGTCSINATVAYDASYIQVTTAVPVTVTTGKAIPTFGVWSDVSKVYGDSAFALSPPSVDNSLAGSWTYSSATPSVLSVSGSTATVGAVGTSLITATFSPTDSTNYTTATVTMTVSVSAASRTLSFATTSYTVTYGQTQTVTAAPSAGSGDGSITYDAGSSTACTVGASTGVVTMTSGTGTCSISASIAAGTNYASANTTTPVTITPAKATAPTFTATNVSKTFGDAAFTLTSPTTSLTGTWAFTRASGTSVTISGSTATVVGAGTSTITATFTPTGTDGNNYSTGSVNFDVVVAQKSLTITAGLSTSTQVYGAATPTPSYSTTGLVSTDTISSVGYRYTGSGSYNSTTAPVTVGSYVVTPEAAVFSSGSASNYNITYVAANYSITKATPVATAPSNITKGYGNADFAAPVPVISPSPAGSWTYVSSSSSVVRVTGATLSVVRLGTVTVTATFTPTDTTNYNGVSTTFDVTVNPTTLATPSAPNVTAVAGSITPGDFVHLDVTWTADPKATSYVVNVYSNSSTVVLATQTITGATSASFKSYTMYGSYLVFTPSTTYRVTVQSIGDGTNYLSSTNSSYASATTPVGPVNPTSLTFTTSGTIDTSGATPVVRTIYGSTLTLTASATVTDSGTKTYTWNYWNGSSWVQSPSGTSGSTSQTLTYSNIQMAKNGEKVRVYVYNKLNGFSTPSNFFYDLILDVSKQTPAVAATSTVSRTITSGTYSIVDAVVNNAAGTTLTGTWSYATSSSAIRISGNTVNLDTTGTASIVGTFTPTDTTNYNTTTTTITLNISAAAQSIAIATSSATYGTDTTLTTTGESGTGSKTYTYVSGPCTISGDQLTPTGIGTCVVNVTIASDANYASATSADKSIAINAASRTLSFATTSYNKDYGTTQTVVAQPSAGSGTITYSRGSSISCTVDPSTGVVTMTAAAGLCEISASIVASGNYTSASTTTPVTITPSKATPTIGTFLNLNTDTATALTLIGQTASLSGGTWSYTSGNASVVTINSATANPTGVGTTTITATYTPSLLDQSNYNSATGTFTITVTAATLATPAAPTVTAGANGIVMNASWTAIAHSSGYLVTLYPNGSITPIGTTQVGSGATTASFSSADYPSITYSTTYRVTVKAIGDGTNFLDSAESAFGSAQSIVATADPTYTVLQNVITTYPGTATFNAAAVAPDGGDLTYVWQYQLPGVSSTWSPISSTPTGYSATGRTSATLSLTGIYTSISGYKFRVVITNTKNSNTATVNTTAASVTVNKQTPVLGTVSTVNVSRGAAYQTITSPSAKDALNASVSGDWTYSSSDTTVATITNTNRLNFATPGTAIITATFTPSGSDTANFNANTTTFVVNVAKTVQTISVSTTSAVYRADTTLITSGSQGTGTISYTKVSGPCTISGDQLHPTGAGTCVVNASIAADTNFAAATSADKSITIAKADRTISFGATTSYSKYYGQTQTVVATADLGTGAITYSAGNSTACSVDAQTGLVTINASSGTCLITATIAADDNYNAATTTTAVSFNVSKRPLTITGHVSSSSVAYNTAIPTNSYTISSGSVAGTDILASVTYIYTGVSNYNSNAPPSNTGTWTVTPSAAVFSSGQADNYDITYVGVSFDIVKADQTISVGTINSQTMTAGSVITQYTATSGLSVTVTTTTPSKCSVGSDRTIYILAVGTCTVEAAQAGNSNWNAAPTVTRSFQIVNEGQVITFASLADKTYGDAPFALSATANSNLTVSFASATTAVCTVSGTTVTILAAGTCTINADQAGNATYSPATRVTRSFTVANAAISNPSIVNAAATPGVLKSISVSWTSVSHISGYVLRLYPASGTTSVADIAVTSSTSRVITTSDYAQLADGTDYRVSIAALGATNYNDSAESAKSTLTSNSAYTITYKTNGSTSGTAPAAGTYITGASPTAIATNSGNLERTGYTFAGWNTLAAGTGTNYTANGTGTFANTENIDLYPVWTPNQITITFNANFGSTPATSTQVFTADAAAGLTFNAFNRSGYMFDGWALTQTGAVAYTDGASFSTIVPLTLYAKWTARDYTVTYQTNGGTGTAPTEGVKNIGNVITVKSAGGINKTGYDFMGWSDGSRIYAAGDSYTMPAGNVIFTAQWQVQVYTITYDGNNSTGGTPVRTSDSYTYGTPAISLTTQGTLARTGYSFAGWSVIPNGTPISGNYTPSSSITLYAVWSANTYTITYNSNGAGGTLAQVSDSYTTGGTAVTLPGAGTLAKTGYTFGGWSTSASGGAISGTYTTSDDVTLYARWVAINYTITYNSNGGATTPTESSKNIGDTFTLAAGPTKANYHFAGWSDGNSTYSEGYRYTVGSSDLTFTAVWVRVYWIHYNFNGANETAPADLRRLDQDSYTASDAVTRAGYNFIGWKATGSNGANAQNADLIAAGETFTVDIDHYILSAQWNAIDYHVTYSSAGGVSVPTQSDKNIGQTFSVGAAPTRAGYTFDGWSDGNLIYGPGAIYAVGTSNIAFTAQWTAIQYDVTYDLSSGTSTPPVQAARIVDQTFVVAARPTRYGYTFDKWTDGTTDYAPGDTYTMPAHDVTLTARWTRTLLSVAYDLNGGTSSTPTETNKGIGDIFGLAAAATWINHTFLGWFDGTNTYAAGSNYTASGENINFVARWVNNLFTAIFNPGGATGNGPANIDKQAGSAFTMPGYGAFTKDGYSFSGWTDGAQAYAIGDTAVMPVGGKEFTATWLQNPTPAPPSSGGGGGGAPIGGGGGGAGGGSSGGGSGGGATGGGSTGTTSNATAILYGAKKKLAAPAAVGTPIKWTTTGSTCKVDAKGVLSTVSVGNCTVTAVYKSTLRIARVYKYVVKPRLQISLKSISNLKPNSARLNAVVAWPGTDFQAKFCVTTTITSTECKFISSISVSNENSNGSKSAVTIARDIQGLTAGTTYYVYAAVIVSDQQYKTATQILKTPAKSAAPTPAPSKPSAPVVSSSSIGLQFTYNTVVLQEQQYNSILESLIRWKKAGYKSVVITSSLKRDYYNYFVVTRMQAVANFIKAQNQGFSVSIVFPKETSGRLVGDLSDAERSIAVTAK